MNTPTENKFDYLLQNLSETEQLDLIAHVAAKLKKKHSAQSPLNLAGYLAGKVDPNFDIDEALQEIRRGWSKEWNGHE
ncbi:hypothetical protein DCC62_07285 [candidate division KSB1 bacterium]|nr:MAG: hypothetical protein DCC62_07285 [candidate division KSB1 bacterium]